MKLIRGASVFFNGRLEAYDILINGEKILGIGKFDPDVKEIIDARGLIVLPGGIDMHVHFNDPGYSHRETFKTGSMGAASSGITTVVDMPCTSIPQVRDLDSLYKKLNVIEKESFVDFCLYGGVTGQEVRKGELNKIKEQWEEGVIGFKIYGYSSAPTYERVSYGEMKELFSFSSEFNPLFTIHAEDFSLVDHFTKIMIKEGRKDTLAWIQARVYEAEPFCIWASSRIAMEEGVRLHIAHLSTGEGGVIVNERKEEGVKITVETTPHFLLLTEEDLLRDPLRVKTSPPVRGEWDRETLWEFLKDGVIDTVASDHFSASWEKEKKKEDIFEVGAGISGIDTIFPLIFSEGVVKGKISLKRFVEVMSENPAKILHIYPRKGTILPGSDADLVFIDMKRRWKIEGKNFYSKGKYTPFEGWEVIGKVVRTMIRGEVVFDIDRGFLVEPGFGKWIKRMY